MDKLEEYKLRLSKKSILELKKIYSRITGIDLLRGTKREMICRLADLLDSRRRWNIISKK
jgi:hypothetical protein